MKIRDFSSDKADFYIYNYLAVDMKEDERFEWCNNFIDEFYPGRDALTEEELLHEKYYKKGFDFQIAIAKKRFIEETKRGSITTIIDGRWQFGFIGRGL